MLYLSSECKHCEDQFCCIYLGQRTCPHHCIRKSCFCARCQITVSNEASQAVFCQLSDFLSECYVYQHIGRNASRNSFILQRYCRDHCPTKDCPHREETTVHNIEEPKDIDYGHWANNGSPIKTVDIQEQSASTEELKDREAPIPCGKGDSRMVPRLWKKNRSGPKGLLATQRSRRAWGSRQQPRGNIDERSRFRCSVAAIVRTRSTGCPSYTGMKWRNRNSRGRVWLT